MILRPLMPNSSQYQPLVHRFAALTVVLALVPITLGAVVTTMQWGMAFMDWPTSDGVNMFLYPWLQAATDKFTEHGHRLAGAMIGVVSIVLAGLAWWKEPRLWVRLCATLVLGCVIVQGLLGAGRVLADDPRMAMVHGVFAAWVLALMAVVACVTGRNWFTIEFTTGNENEQRKDVETRRTQSTTARRVQQLKPWAIALPVVVFVQSLLGGALRHLGGRLYEHIALGVVVLIFVLATAIAALFSGAPWLRRAGVWLGWLVVAQIALGAGAFITRFGWPSTGYVAVARSTPQVLFRTGHTLVGVLLFATSVVYAVRVVRTAAVFGGGQAAPTSRRTESRSFAESSLAPAAGGGG